MCMSEVEGIRLKLESELREKLKLEEDHCRMAASPDQCRSRSSTYLPLSEATSRIEELLNQMSLRYEEEIVVTVGELEGDLSSQVRSTSNTLFTRALGDAKESYLASYHKYFQEWIRCLVKVKTLVHVDSPTHTRFVR